MGSPTRRADQVARDLRHYLEQVAKGPDPIGRVDPTRNYYADSAEQPGRWSGHGAEHLGLVGEVDGAAFEAVMAGRDPKTGERLVSAQGSAGRAHLAVGRHSRLSADGRRLWDLHDAASVLGIRPAEITGLANIAPTSDGDGMWLQTIDVDGAAHVTEDELARLQQLMATGVAAHTVRQSGPADELLGLPEAARLARVSPQYLGQQAQRWVDHLRHRSPNGESDVSWFRATKTRGRWSVTRGALADWIDQRRPPAVIVGYDVTATFEKSLSLLAVLGSEQVRVEVLASLEAGNRAAMEYMERHGAKGRRCGQPVETEGLSTATYLHGTSRSLDPHVHFHNLVANAVVDEHGDRRALDGQLLFSEVTAAGSVGTAAVREHLTRALGVEWRPTRSGQWEIEGIGDDLINRFATRRREIETVLQEMTGAVSAAQVDVVAKATRDPKQHPTDAAAVVARWRAQANELGYDHRRIAAVTNVRHRAVEPLTADEIGRLHVDLIDAVTAESSVFTRGQLLRAVADWTPDQDKSRLRVVPARQIEAIADGFLASGHVIEIDTGKRQPTFSTVKALERQLQILDTARNGRATDSAQVDTVSIEASITAAGTLSVEQADLVRAVCGSGDRVQCAIGRPGTGKTYTMAAAARAWETDGYRLLGAAVKGEAARGLGTAAGIKAETLAWYLTKDTAGDPAWDGRTVLIVDEASTISDTDLAHLIAASQQHGFAIRLIGDPAQHGAVPAGGMFAQLIADQTDRAPELTINRRTQNPHEQAAAEHLRRGRTTKALASLDTAGSITVVENLPDAAKATLQRWQSTRAAGAEHPMVVRTNDLRHALNNAAQQIRLHNNELSTDALPIGNGLHVRVGDRVMARRPGRTEHPTNNPQAHIRNGATGTVIAINPTPDATTPLTVDFDGLGQIALHAEWLHDPTSPQGLDLAYALTSYAVQGATLPESTSIIDTAASRPETYVDITRGIAANHAVIVQRPADTPTHGDNPDSTIEPLVALARHLASSEPEQPAIAYNPYATWTAQQLANQHSLAQLRIAAGADHTANPEISERLTAAYRLEANNIRRQALANPPTRITERIRPKPTTPWQARRWEIAVAHTAVYLQEYNIAERWRTGTGYEPLLGQTPTDPNQRARYDELTEHLRHATITIAPTSARAPIYPSHRARPSEPAGRAR